MVNSYSKEIEDFLEEIFCSEIFSQNIQYIAPPRVPLTDDEIKAWISKPDECG